MSKQAKYEGFFSVEAALVIPIVLGVYLFLIVMLFLQYDRCLLEQDMASMMVKAGNYKGTPQKTMEYLQELTAQWDRERYLWMQPQAPYITVRGSQIRLQEMGEYMVPVLGISDEIGGAHHLETVYQLTAWDRTALVEIIQNYKNSSLQTTPVEFKDIGAIENGSEGNDADRGTVQQRICRSASREEK